MSSNFPTSTRSHPPPGATRRPRSQDRNEHSITSRASLHPRSRHHREIFETAYGVKHPKAVAKVVDDLEGTTNPIESTFATVRHRTKVTKGPGSRAAGLAMSFKLIESAQARWRAVNAPHLVALVWAGAEFKNGKLVERPEGIAA
ncbi:hypothetical protein GCM10027589_21400 [Actinocorallia lasiicapitis]